jgi:hypothetical protein
MAQTAEKESGHLRVPEYPFIFRTWLGNMQKARVLPMRIVNVRFVGEQIVS